MILAVTPALPLHAAGKYVAAAYIVFVVVLLVYLAIMTIRTSRTSRELAELRRELAERRAHAELGEPQGVSEEPARERRHLRESGSLQEPVL